MTPLALCVGWLGPISQRGTWKGSFLDGATGLAGLPSAEFIFFREVSLFLVTNLLRSDEKRGCVRTLYIYVYIHIYIYKWIYMDIPGPCISMSTIGNCESFPEGRCSAHFQLALHVGLARASKKPTGKDMAGWQMWVMVRWGLLL